MGYQTYYVLETEHLENKEQCAADFKNITNITLARLSDDSTKWYNHDADMTKLSLLHPDAIFTLYGEGENVGDEWKTVYCNGDRCTVSPKKVWPTIDVSKIGGIGERRPEYFL